jgi:hypothetical protein
MGGSLTSRELADRTIRFGNLKLLELKTMCSSVTLRDRPEPVVAHPDCDQCPGGRSCHGFTANCAAQAVSCWTVENSVFTCGSPSSGARFHWHAQVYGASSRTTT